MKTWPKEIPETLTRIVAALKFMARARDEDIAAFRNLANVFMRGRKVGRIPTSSTDVVAGDRVGDFSYDSNFVYFMNTPTTWKTLPFTDFSAAAYGSMGADDVSLSITIAAVGVYYKIASGLSEGIVEGFAFQNASELKCLVAGVYKIDFSLTLETGAANQEVAGAVMVGAAVEELSEGMSQVPSANKGVCVGGTCVHELAVNDLVGLCVENETSTANITMTHANLALVRVGDS